MFKFLTDFRLSTSLLLIGSKLGINMQDDIVLDREAASRLCFDRPPLGLVSVSYHQTLLGFGVS